MTHRARSSIAVAAGALVVLAFLGASPLPAAAGGLQIHVGAAPWPGSTQGWRHGHPRGQSRVIVTDPRSRIIVTDPGTRVIVVPRTYYYAPAYVAPVYAPRWVPGYWTHQWVPQVSTEYVYVPGHYTTEGEWVESHYLPRLTQTGQYQPVWVDGYWAR